MKLQIWIRELRTFVIQRARSLGIAWCLELMEWTSQLLLKPGLHSEEILRRERVGWAIEDKLQRLFGFFYDGSDEEIEAVYNCEIPRRYMSARQRYAGLEMALRGQLFDEVICIHCEFAPLLVTDETNYCADCRALHPEMLLEDRK